MRIINIPIGEDYKVTTDSNNFILHKKRIGESGKSKGKLLWEVIGYYGKLESALQGYKNLRIKESEATSIQILLRDIEKIDEVIKETLKGV